MCRHNPKADQTDTFVLYMGSTCVMLSTCNPDSNNCILYGNLICQYEQIPYLCPVCNLHMQYGLHLAQLDATMFYMGPI